MRVYNKQTCHLIQGIHQQCSREWLTIPWVHYGLLLHHMPGCHPGISPSIEQHQRDLGKVFEVLNKLSLQLKYSKCEFFKKKVSFLDKIIFSGGLAACPDKVSALVNCKKHLTGRNYNLFWVQWTSSGGMLRTCWKWLFPCRRWPWLRFVFLGGRPANFFQQEKRRFDLHPGPDTTRPQ